MFQQQQQTMQSNLISPISAQDSKNNALSQPTDPFLDARSPASVLQPAQLNSNDSNLGGSIQKQHSQPPRNNSFNAHPGHTNLLFGA